MLEGRHQRRVAAGHRKVPRITNPRNYIDIANEFALSVYPPTANEFSRAGWGNGTTLTGVLWFPVGREKTHQRAALRSLRPANRRTGEALTDARITAGRWLAKCYRRLGVDAPRTAVAAQNRLYFLMQDKPRPDRPAEAEHKGEQPDDAGDRRFVSELHPELSRLAPRRPAASRNELQRLAEGGTKLAQHIGNGGVAVLGLRSFGTQ